jgi:predicted nucleic acid-binding protein
MTASDPDLAFVDTNVLVYAATQSDRQRGSAARDLIRWLSKGNALFTSTQVLQECYVVLTTKGKPAFRKDQALRFIEDIAAHTVFQVDYRAIRDSADLSEVRRISFWDALIVVAASRSGARRLYTEDLQHGQVIEGVEIVNPFRAM